MTDRPEDVIRAEIRTMDGLRALSDLITERDRLREARMRATASSSESPTRWK
jgi:hypothetical protein